jgi:hypothetical protein
VSGTRRCPLAAPSTVDTATSTLPVRRTRSRCLPQQAPPSHRTACEVGQAPRVQTEKPPATSLNHPTTNPTRRNQTQRMHQDRQPPDPERFDACFRPYRTIWLSVQYFWTTCTDNSPIMGIMSHQFWVFLRSSIGVYVQWRQSKPGCQIGNGSTQPEFAPPHGERQRRAPGFAS